MTSDREDHAASDGRAPSPQQLSRGDLQNRAIRGAVWTVIHTGLSLPLAFVINILIARVLGVVDYGRLAYLSTVMDIVGGIISLGIGTALVQFGAKAHAAGRFDEVSGLLSRSQGFRLFLTAPIMVIVVIWVADVQLSLLIVAIIFGVLLPSALDGAPACFAIENKTDAGARNAIIVNLLTQAAVITAVFVFRSADSIWAARMIAGGLGVALALFYIRPSYRRAIFHPRLPRGFPHGFWRFALPAGAAGLIGNLVVSRSEVVVLTWMHATEAAGTFALAFGLANHLFSPAQALIGPLVPAVSGLREVDEGSVGRALTRTLRAGSTIVAVLIGAALPAFAALVPVIYGPSYSQVPEVLLVLGIAGGLIVVAGPVQAFVQARLSGGRLLWVNIIALVVDLGLAVALIPHLGVWGAVIANVGAACVQLGLLLTGEVRSLGLSWRATGRSVIPSAVGAGASLASWFGVKTIAWGAIPSAIAAAGLGMLLVILGLRATKSGLTPADAEAIQRALPAAARRAARPALALITHAK